MKLKKGKKIQIHGFKHDGSLHRVWTNSFVVDDNESYLVTGNYRTKVIESNGRSWYTKEPALCYFFEKEWFNVIAMYKKDGIHYYCNVSSPYVYDTEAIKYIDYDLDVRVYPSGRIVVLDHKEFRDNSLEMNYSEDIKNIANNAVVELKTWIKDKRPPFDKVTSSLNLETFEKILTHEKELKALKTNQRKGNRDNERK